MHSGQKGRTQSSQVVCDRSVSLEMGTLSLEDYPKFLERMENLLELANKKQGRRAERCIQSTGQSDDIVIHPDHHKGHS